MENVQAVKQRFGYLIRLALSSCFMLMLLCSIVLITAIGCTKETTIIVVQESEDPQQEDPDDTDGDSVKNIIEEIDGTNPNDPCSYEHNRFNYANTTQAWRDLDCDDDGVTNGKELDPDGDGVVGANQTDPRQPCDFKQNNQVYSTTSTAWRTWDCDFDGVTNGDEIDPDGNNLDDGNGTNPLDECDLVIAQQNGDPPTYWLELDCDEDCLSNGQELIDGTDPLDGSDYLGAGGDAIAEIRENQNGNSFGRKHLFDPENSRYIGTLKGNGEFDTNFIYDANNQLESMSTTSTGQLITLEYEYTNGLITKIDRTKSGSTSTKTVEYIADTIFTYLGNEPNGLFHEKFVMDNSTGKVIDKESYYQVSNGIWRYGNSDYEYTSGMTNLLRKDNNIQGYNPTTGEFYSLSEDYFFNERYEYTSGPTLNPVRTALEPVYLNYILAEETLSGQWLKGGKGASFSEKFLFQYWFINDASGSYNQFYIYCESPTFLPVVGGGGCCDGFGWSLNFIYD